MVLEILIVLTIVIIVSVFISLPFFRKNEFGQPHSEDDSRQIQETMIEKLNVLNNEKESIYNALKDIEFDYEIGKLSKNDFEELNMSYKSKAVSLLKEIDEISNEIKVKATQFKLKEDNKTESEEGSGEDEAMEGEILQIRNSNKTLESFMKCLNCGVECNPDDLFCSKCGAKLRVEKIKMKPYKNKSYLFIMISLCFYFTGDAFSADPSHSVNNGRELFIKNGCVNCHTIGRGRFVGPDLSGIGSRYTKDEIKQWIMNPQIVYKIKGKMPINDGYPPMPPLEISGDDAELISDYLLSNKTQRSADRSGGIIRGEVINNKKSGEGGVELVLKAFMGDRETDVRRAKTNEKGEFEFLDLQWDRGYTISLNYKGAEYVTDKMVFYPDQDEKVLELPVYETTESDSDISIEEGHMIIKVSDGSINVVDFTILNNKGEDIFIGKNGVEGGRRETLSFSIPNRATNINLIDGLSQEMLVRTSDGFSDTQGVWPGIKRVVYTYTLPYESGRNEILKRFNYLTDSFLLLVSNTGQQVDVKGLEGGDTVEIDGNSFLRWNGNDLKPNTDIIIYIKKPFDPIFILKLIALGVLLSFICAGIIYSALFKK